MTEAEFTYELSLYVPRAAFDTLMNNKLAEFSNRKLNLAKARKLGFTTSYDNMYLFEREYTEDEILEIYNQITEEAKKYVDTVNEFIEQYK